MAYAHKFVEVKQPGPSATGETPGFQLRVVSYNILAQVYVKSKLFPHSPAASLRWKSRSQALAGELLALDADVLCLQEVDEFAAFYEPLLAARGYGHVYAKRPGTKKDGSAIFFRKSRLSLAAKHTVDYNDLVASVPAGDPQSLREGEVDLRVRLKRDCVGVLAAFTLTPTPTPTPAAAPAATPTPATAASPAVTLAAASAAGDGDDCSSRGAPAEGGGCLLVACTHLYWDPAWADVKLAQAAHLLSSLAAFRSSVTQSAPQQDIVEVVCGDFNSLPGDEVYNYLTSAGSPTTSSGSVHETSAPKLPSAPVTLKSVYALVGREPSFTTYTPDFTGTLDYILVSPSGVKIRKLLSVPKEGDESIAGGLPNSLHPSDHLPIGAELELCVNNHLSRTPQ